MRPRPRPTLALLLSALTLGVAGCAEPSVPTEPEAAEVDAPTESPTPEPEREELLATVEVLMDSLAGARDLLAEAAGTTDTAAGREAAEAALSLLVVDLGGGDPDGTPVFPSVTAEERGGSGSADDALTLTLTAANDAGGTVGDEVSDVLRDPLAGDLGAWQRDPAGLIELARQAGDDAADLESLEAAVFELPGEGTRAIAWTMLAADATSADDVATYAERAATHLDFAIDAVRAAIGGSEDT